jgi:hypothetical protein
MASKLDLEKGKEALKLNLAKRGVHAPPAAELAFVLDVSGSFDSQHRSGVTQKLLERLVPWGMLFDPDQKLDVFTFATDAVHVGDITPETTDGYIKREIVDQVSNYNGATYYARVLEMTLENFGWIKKGGLLGRIFGGNQEKRRSIVLFVTDGDNADHSEARKILKDSEARKDEVYFLFIGIGHDRFPFLQKIADEFSNTGLTVIQDMRQFVAQSDDQVNDALIGDELITWLKK